jgi:hypothetical protein
MTSRSSCSGCGGGEAYWSEAARLWLCEACYCRTPSARFVAPRGRVVKLPPPPPAPKPSRYALLWDRVYGALQRATEEVTGERFGVFGLGDPELPLVGYCPVCATGTVAIRLLDTDPPRARTEGCSAGCSAELIAGVL